MTLAFNTVFREASQAAAKLTFDRDMVAEIAGLVARSVMAERERCATIVHDHQIAFCSDACGWALDKIKDGLPADAARVAK
jgi:hypothetical protein